MPIEQNESKLVQDVTLVKSHVLHNILLPNGAFDLCKTEGEITVLHAQVLCLVL